MRNLIVFEKLFCLRDFIELVVDTVFIKKKSVFNGIEVKLKKCNLDGYMVELLLSLNEDSYDDVAQSILWFNKQNKEILQETS